MSAESVMSSNCLILPFPLLLLHSIFSSIRVFSDELALRIRWPKYWSFSFSISPSNAYSGLISFRIDWFDLLAVQENLKSLLQHHSLKASILWHSAFFKVRLSHPYMTTGKSNFDYMDLCQQSGDSAFNALSRFVISLARPQASWWPRLQGLAPRRLRLSFVRCGHEHSRPHLNFIASEAASLTH